MVDFDLVSLPETDHVAEGDRAPDFTRPLVNDEFWADASLSELTDEGPVCLVFYPMDGAFPATYIWNEIRDRAWGDSLTVVGVSISTPYEHKTFIHERGMDYRLFSDPADGVARAYPLDGYWRDVGTLEAYWAAHMDLLGAEPRLVEAGLRPAIGLPDQVGKLERAARPRSQALAVRPVHGAELDVFQPALVCQISLDCGAKDLLEMVRLAEIDDVENEIGIVSLAPVENGGEIGGGIERRALA